MAAEKHIEVKCLDCHFSKEVAVTDGKLPAEVLIEHGRETGHTVIPTYPDD